MDLFTLAAKITVDSSEYEKGLQDAETQGKTLSSRFDKLVSGAKKVAAAMVFKKGIDSMKAFVQQAADAGDRIDKNSQKLGISRKAFQEWDFILSQCGASIDSLGTGMKTLNNKIESGTAPVDRLGLSMENLSKMNMEQRFSAIVEAFQQMPESAEKSALAVEMFGKQGMELMPLLNSAPGSLEAMRDRFHELGIEMSDKQIDAAVHYTDTMDQLNRTLEAGKILIGSELMPAFQSLAENGVKYASDLLKAYKGEDGGKGGLAGVLDMVTKSITDGLPKITEEATKIATSIGNAIAENAPKIIAAFGEIWKAIGEGLEATDSPILQGVGKLMGFIYDLISDPEGTLSAAWDTVWTGIQKVASDIWKSIKEAASSAWEAIKGFWTENIAEPIEEAWKSIAEWFDLNVWQPISNFFNTMWTSVSELWGDISTAVSDAWKLIAEWFNTNVFEPISNFFTTAWTTISELWGDISTAVSDAWTSIATWFDENVWQPISNFFAPMWTTISDLWGDISTAISNAWTSVATWFDENVWQPIASFFSPVWETIKQLWTDISTNISNAWSVVEGILSPIIEPIKALFQGVADVVSSIWNFLSSIFGLGDKTINVTTNYITNGTPPSSLPSSANQSPSSQKDLTNPKNKTTTDPKNWAPSYMKAKGDWNVPYDDYPAKLHRGEMVLTASQARRYREGENGFDYSSLASTIVGAIREGMQGAQVNSYLDGKRLTDEVSAMLGSQLAARRFV